jgi:hypothetical protein
MNRSSAAAPDPSLVKDALRRIFELSGLQEASLPGKVLTYVVERTLAGDSRSIKAYTIAVEALGRAPDFDPDRDSTVRVAAMRLRGALDLYYAGPGAADPLRIRLFPGSYRPVFECAPNAPQAPLPQTPAAGLPDDEARPPVALTVPLAAIAQDSPRRLAGTVTRWWLAAVTVALTVDILVTASLLVAQVAGRQREVKDQAMAARQLAPAEANPTLFALIHDGIERSFRNSTP